MDIQENFSLKTFNTFHVEARARYFAHVTQVAQLQEALSFVREHALRFMLIGQGSNLLFKEDYDGLIIELNVKGIELVGEDSDSFFVQAQCGESWHEFVCYCLDQAYYGLENLSLIPGTIGAAPVQNIGAYGVEIKDLLFEVQALEIATGKLRTFSNAECEFSYRNSVFKQGLKDQFIITSVVFQLHKEPQLNLSYPALQKALADVPAKNITPELVGQTVTEIRRSRLPNPDVLGNAGSFFWNPIIPQQEYATLQAKHPGIVGFADGDSVKLAAAWLIDQAGWKGYREGDVGVHQDHALVLVNYGSATGSELVSLAEKIQASVKAKFGIALWPEVRII